MIKYLVTGTGRCGSVYMARLLTSLGYMCGHESVFDYKELKVAKLRLERKLPLITSKTSKDRNEWFNPQQMVAESSYMAAPFLDDPCFDNIKIIHVVRHPLQVVSSHHMDINFFDDTNKNLSDYKNFVFNHLPNLKTIDNKLERACYYYIYWNRMIEDKSKNREYLLHKAENECNQKLMDFLQIKSVPDNIFKNNKINSWKKRQKDITLSDIPEGEIKKEFIETMKRYGYIITML